MWFGGGIIISGLFSEEAVAILNFLPDPLFIIDQGQQVLWSNRQAGDIFGSDTGGNETLAGVTGIEKLSAWPARSCKAVHPWNSLSRIQRLKLSGKKNIISSELRSSPPTTTAYRVR